MANGSKLTLTEYIAKFTDVATLSKLVTDIGPGFLTALSLVLLFNFLTGIPLLPFQRYDEILGRIKATKERIQKNQGRISALRNSRVSLEAAKAELTAKKPEPKDSPTLEREKKRLEIEAVNAIKEEAELVEKAIPNAEQKLKELKTKSEEAGSLSHNMKELDDHVLSVLFISLIFGVILSQAAGQLIYNGYRRKFYDDVEKGNTKISADLLKYVVVEAGGPPTNIAYYQARKEFDATKQKAYDEIVRDYYRYLEVCINMVVPTTLFVLTLTAIVISKIRAGESVYIFALVLLVLFGWGGVVLLMYGGYDYFKHYGLRIAHFIRGLWEEWHPPPVK